MSKKELQPINTTKRRRILAGCAIGCSIAIIGAGAGVGIGYAVWANGSERIVNKTVKMQSIKDNKAYNLNHVLPYRILNSDDNPFKPRMARPRGQSITVEWLESKLHVYNFYNCFLQQSNSFARDWYSEIRSCMANILADDGSGGKPPSPTTGLPEVYIDDDASYIHFDHITWDKAHAEISAKFSVSVHFDIVGYTSEYHAWMDYQMKNNSKDYPSYLEKLEGNNILTFNYDIQKAWILASGKDPTEMLGGIDGEIAPSYSTWMYLSGNPASYSKASLNGMPITYSFLETANSNSWTLDFFRLVPFLIDIINIHWNWSESY